MSFYSLLRPALFGLPAETAHTAVTTLLSGAQRTPATALARRHYRVDDPRLSVSLFDQRFPTPVGVAAGFDKNGEFPRALEALGFGHVEIGGVTADPQAGNPQPRMFRLPEDEAIVNRMGFNNDGADRVGARLERSELPDVPVGVNIGKSKATPPERAPDDYRYTYRRLAEYGDFFVVNVSSPNTPGLRDLQGEAHLRGILTALREAGANPLLVKLSPDLSSGAIADAIGVVSDLNLDGIVATNTSAERPESLRGRHRNETGGLSGRPIEPRSTDVIRFIATRTDVPIVGVGGVFTAADAYRKIRAGASLVQLYTGLVYRGPSIAKEISEGLLTLLERDGFDSVEKAVGADLE
ncbi:quinone-dependent dihydroorotate dehydrogenase [Halalkalicoccus jeotgali]|uniref:Dihydroorotate dehydrogenase (quinone) n=1 Tax=Halalkalicoccus jeotgali (strain DSM 18796 / CECT 7217 / JCM 14584 / KCTC 4019 / B3) TaxID=795797 RepID=D8J3R8_HALJB|nr:quinone-dependent dihydroorotate dehydrogenase [Halalkalicoccus jeotgali]ADJ13409.1 dihydroorotate dehydrogenase 2 [Halalkalicoccus jeotgali B3]ELY32759.1 dihydroorotate dehydrogenase 2 [Halalkalicoccus jeotgali B3]